MRALVLVNDTADPTLVLSKGKAQQMEIERVEAASATHALQVEPVTGHELGLGAGEVEDLLLAVVDITLCDPSPLLSQ